MIIDQSAVNQLGRLLLLLLLLLLGLISRTPDRALTVRRRSALSTVAARTPCICSGQRRSDLLESYPRWNYTPYYLLICQTSNPLHPVPELAHIIEKMVIYACAVLAAATKAWIFL